MRRRGYWPPRGFATPAVKLRPQVRKPCKYLGGPTGELVYCPECSAKGGKIELKVLACAIHKTCTPARKVEGHQCCAVCPDWEESK